MKEKPSFGRGNFATPQESKNLMELEPGPQLCYNFEKLLCEGLNVDLWIIPLGGLIVNSVGTKFGVESDGDAVKLVGLLVA